MMLKAAADALRKKGLPESFAQMLLRGVSLDAIIKEDQAKEEYDGSKLQGNSEGLQEISKKYWPDTEHYMQVSKLALEFFDGLIKLHQFGSCVNDAGLNAPQFCMILACQNPEAVTIKNQPN